jgi:hypothetical protein
VADIVIGKTVAAPQSTRHATEVAQAEEAYGPKPITQNARVTKTERRARLGRGYYDYAATAPLYDYAAAPAYGYAAPAYAAPATAGTTVVIVNPAPAYTARTVVSPPLCLRTGLLGWIRSGRIRLAACRVLVALKTPKCGRIAEGRARERESVLLWARLGK